MCELIEIAFRLLLRLLRGRKTTFRWLPRFPSGVFPDFFGRTESTIIICTEPDYGTLPEINFWNRGSLRIGSHSHRNFRSLIVML